MCALVAYLGVTCAGNVAKVASPKRGWTAYMVEMTFPSGLLIAPFKFTTGVKVIPDVEPFADEVPTNGK